MTLSELYVIIFFLVIGGMLWWFYHNSRSRDHGIMPVAYDQIVASVHDAVLVLNPDAYVIGLNTATERLLGIPRAQLISLRLSSVLNLPPDTPISGEASAEFEHVIGTTVCEVNSVPLLSDKTVIGRILVLRDITARKQAEREARELDFERERARILTLFIRNASHEFRTPVTVIKTSLYLLSRQTDPDKRAKQVTTIEQQIDRLSRLIDDLQKMAVLDGTPDLQRIETDLHPFLHATAQKIEARANGRVVRVSLSESPLICEFDAHELDQALMRVFDNAIRYSPPESVIHLSTNRDGESACIRIQDHGIGMDAEALKKATQRFYRNDSAHTTAGFGLGLPIAKTIIELHGGTLSLDSIVGEGTTVTIRLPLTAQIQTLNLPARVP